MRKFVFFLGALCMLPSLHALANADAGLYDPVPPEGSSFVRFVSMDQDDGSKQAKINNKPVEYVRYKDVSSYFVTPKGMLETQVGDVKKDFEIESGKFYTVILKENQELQILQDEENNNQAKAQLIFYNFSPDSNLSLKTNDGKVEIIPEVASGNKGSQKINPVKVSLAIYNGDKMIKDLGAVSMERSKSYSVVAFPNSEVKWIASTTNTTR